MSVEKGVYRHIVQGTCTKHGPAAVECMHPFPGCTEGDLVKTCVICMAEAEHAEKNPSKEGPPIEAAKGE